MPKTFSLVGLVALAIVVSVNDEARSQGVYNYRWIGEINKPSRAYDGHFSDTDAWQTLDADDGPLPPGADGNAYFDAVADYTVTFGGEHTAATAFRHGNISLDGNYNSDLINVDTEVGLRGNTTLETDKLLVGVGFYGGLTVNAGTTLQVEQVIDEAIASIGNRRSGYIQVRGGGARFNTLGGGLIVGQREEGILEILDGGATFVRFSNPAHAGLDVGVEPGIAGVVTLRGAGSRLDVTEGATQLGRQGEGRMEVSEGGKFSASAPDKVALWLGVLKGSSGHLIVDGNGSRLDTLGAFHIAGDGTGDAIFTNQGIGDVQGDVRIGSFTAAGTLTVSRDASFKNTGFFAVGESMGSGTVTVESGGKLQTGFGFVGVGGEGMVTVRGPQSTWQTNFDVNIGVHKKGTVTVQSGGKFSSAEKVTLGDEAGSNGTLILDGASSTFSSKDLIVGNKGRGEFVLKNGAAFERQTDFDLGVFRGAIGSVVVEGSGSKFKTQLLTIGQGGTGELRVSAGGDVQSTVAYIADGEQTSGMTTISGTNSKWTLSNELSVAGVGGTGTLTVSDGAVVKAQRMSFGQDDFGGSARVMVQRARLDCENGLAIESPTSTASLEVLDGQVMAESIYVNGGSLMVDGASARVDAETYLDISNGALSLKNHARAKSRYLQIGTLVSDNPMGKLTIDGQGTEVSAEEALVGRDARGEIELSNNGRLTVSSLTLGGEAGGNGRVRVAGSGAVLNITSLDATSFTVGDSGVGSLTVQEGGRTEFLSPALFIGGSPGGFGTVTVTGQGSTLSSLFGTVNVGFGTGELKVNAGAEVQAGLVRIGASPGSVGRVEVTAGSKLKAREIRLAPQGAGALTIDGGYIQLSDKLTVGPQFSFIVANAGSIDIGVLVGGPEPGVIRVGPFGTLASSARLNARIKNLGGTVHVGSSPGTLNVTGDYFQDANGTLSFTVNGTAAGTQYSQLIVGGALNLAGNVMLDFEEGFAPKQGQTFNLITAASFNAGSVTTLINDLEPAWQYTLSPLGSNYTLTSLSDAVSTVQAWSNPAGGDWSSAANWAQGIVPDSNARSAFFGPVLTADGAVSLGNVSRTVQGLSFRHATNTYTISSTDGAPLVLHNADGRSWLRYHTGNAKNHSIAAHLSLQSDVDVDLGESILTLGGQIDWNGHAIDLDEGTLRFAGPSNALDAAGAKLQIATGARVELTGAGAATSDGVNNVAVTNDGVLAVISANQILGHITGAGIVEVGASANATIDSLKQTGLLLAGDAKLNVRQDSGISTLRALSIAGTIDAWTGRLNLANNDAVLQPSLATKGTDFARLYNQLKQGFNNGDWKGLGVTSATAAANTNAETGLSVIDNALLGYTNFSGQPVTSDSVLLKYTYYGDIDANGQVDADDLTVFASNFGRTSGAMQIDGDIDFNGAVNADDLTVFANNFNKGVGNPFGVKNVQAVPEPASLVLVLLAVASTLAGFRIQRKHDRRIEH